MALSKEGKTWRVLHGGMVVTMDGERNVYGNGGIVVCGSEIVAVGEQRQILDEYESRADEIVDLSGCLILPGLINTHVHTSQQLGRGIADDVDLLTWLHKRIWPYESNMTDNDSYVSTLLCGIELIRSGVTCFAEAGGQHVPAMARAVEALGIRACLTRSTMDSGEGLPSSWANETTDSCIKIQEELYKGLNGSAGGRIRVWFGLRQILNATDALLLRTKEAADRCKTGIHMHVAEIPYENEHVIKTRNVVNGTVTHLKNIGVLGENLLAAHSVWIKEPEVEMMAETGVKVSHCPASAMRMLGFCPVQEMLEKGVCVSIGTDGAPSNNRMSMVDEMYLASLINKGKLAFSKGATDPTALPAEVILAMATINGAKSVLWEDQIGSIEASKKADLVVINPQTWSMVPLHDPISSLVYSMRSENIESVMCDGSWIMRDRKILTIDEAATLKLAAHAAEQLIYRSGIQIPTRMKTVKLYRLSSFIQS